MRRRPAVAFGLAWFWITLIPVVGFVPLAFLSADRWLLVPTVGLALALADLWRDQRPRRLAWAGILAAVFAGLAFLRARQYREDVALWEAAVARSPRVPEAHANLATAYVVEKRYDEAERELHDQIVVAPDKVKPRRDLFAFHLLRSPMSTEEMLAFLGRFDAFVERPDLARAAMLAAHLRRAGAVKAAEQIQGMMAQAVPR